MQDGGARRRRRRQPASPRARRPARVVIRAAASAAARRGSSAGHGGQHRDVTRAHDPSSTRSHGRDLDDSTHGAFRRQPVNRSVARASSSRDSRAGLRSPGRVMARPTGASAEWDADEAVTHLFAAHYRPLVRLARLLLHDRADGRGDRAGRVRRPARATGAASGTPTRPWPTCGSRWSTGCRSALRHRKVVAAHLAAGRPPADAPSAEAGALDLLTQDAVVGRSAGCRPASGRRSCCATTPTCPRRRSPRRWGSAGARSRATPRGRRRPAARAWSGLP